MPRVAALPAAELMLIVGNLTRSGVAQQRVHRDGAIESALTRMQAHVGIGCHQEIIDRPQAALLPCWSSRIRSFTRRSERTGDQDPNHLYSGPEAAQSSGAARH